MMYQTKVLTASLSIVKSLATFDEKRKKGNVLNSLNVLLGMEPVDVARHMVENHRSHEMRCGDPVEDGGTLLFSFLQHYLDKSKTKMKVNGLTFFKDTCKVDEIIWRVGFPLYWKFKNSRGIFAFAQLQSGRRRKGHLSIITTHW